MLHQEFHDLFRPPMAETGAIGKKRSEKHTKISSKWKHRNKYYSMNRDMRLAHGILRQMVHHRSQPPQFGPSPDVPSSSSAIAVRPLSRSASPFIELGNNPSQFSVFAAIRQCVLEKHLKNAAVIYNQTFGRVSQIDDSDDDDDDDPKCNDTILKVPKVVGLGLCVAFELIRESRHSHPSLCIRSLRALLDALQGQLPEGLKNEPSDVISPLFDLLLDLASSYHDTISVDTPSSSSSNTTNYSSSSISTLKSYACSALLSLVTARGFTGKILTAIASLLTSPQLISNCDEIEAPNILISLQRSVHAVLLGKTKRPDWLTHGFPINSLCDSFHVEIPLENSTHVKQSSLAFDGKYLYLYSGNVIYKIGSGYCGTVKGQVISSRSIGSHKSESGLTCWIGYVRDNLYLQTNNWTRNELIKLDKDSLKETGKVTLGVSHWGPSACASDTDNLILITATKDDSFVIRTLKPSSQSCSSPVPSTSYLMPVIQELNIKLSHKCISVCGGSASNIFEPISSVSGHEQIKQHCLRPIAPVEADDIVQISAGKDFAVIRTLSGKLLFTGKPQSLGMKPNGLNASKWCELSITKSPKINHISIGHEGSHALVVAEDGSVFFVGLAKRGEDGEQSKARRQPKAGKPKKMIKMEGKCVEFTACNYGTSAIVTKNGELFMFGKDAHHADRNTGQITALKNVMVTHVALGKAHGLALTNKGYVYSFGISNKGQCGYDLMQTSSVKELNISQSNTADDDIDTSGGGGDQQIDMSEDVIESLCTFGHHRWKYDQCMICTICGECTGYGSSCIASGKSERNPGMPCGCGAGEAGCADCGCCRACEAVSKDPVIQENDRELQWGHPPSNNRLPPIAICPPNVSGDVNAGEMQRFAASAAGYAIVDGGPSANGVLNNEHEYEELHGVRGIRPADISRYNARHGERRLIGLGRRLRHAKIYRNYIAGAEGKANGIDASGNGVEMGPPIEVIDRAVYNVINIDLDQGSDGEATKLTPLPPTKLNIPNRIVQIACGLHHSVLLTSTGDVYTFGSNTHGQLGHGDFLIRETPTKVHLNSTIVQIAAGSNHTVLLSSQGQVYTFGNSLKGQLGRAPSAIDYAWNALPGIMPNIGSQFGRKATLIAASADHTFIKFDESLINPLSLSSVRVITNRKCIAIIPQNVDSGATVGDGRYDSNDRAFRSLIINRNDGTCKTFNTADQLELANFSAVCLDNIYDILWTYNSETQTISRHNIIAVEAKIPQQSMTLPSILLPELSLPQKPLTPVNRTTAALNLLCTLETLTSSSQLGWTVQDDDQTKNQIAKIYSKDDFSSVCRFESHGGGWGFSSHSIEAIRFMADADILLGGFGLFGGRGEYTAKLKLFDIGLDGGEQEGDGEILAETDEIPYECASRQKYSILFDEPIPLQANRWYVAWGRISGPSSDCGSSGQSVVNTEDQVIFYFKSSKKSNNGTDVNAGQIPQLLYKVNAIGNDPTNQCVSVRSDYDTLEEPICIISREFSLTVTTDCFISLLKLLRWSWSSFKANLTDMNSYSNGSVNVISSMLIELKHLSYICCASLHLLKVYINEVFPNGPKHKSRQSITNDSVKLAECVYDVRTQMTFILSDPPESPPRNQSHSSEVNCYICQIMEECHDAFLSCYHAFYPSSSLRWRGLCDLLLSSNAMWGQSRKDFLFSAMLAALCRPWVRLTHTFPMLYGLDINNLQSPSELLSPSAANKDFGGYQHPILSEKISEKTDKEGSHSGSECTFRDIINKLLRIIGEPIEYILQQENNSAPCEVNLREELSDPLYESGHSSQLVENACNLISTVVSELVAQVTRIGYDSQAPIGQQLHITPSRFSRISQNRTWNTGNGSPDAICFSVDKSGISIAGATVYGGIGNEWHYELELLDYNGVLADDRIVARDVGQSHHWRTIEMVRGSYIFEDKSVDVCEIKFDRPIPIQLNVKYALRLRNHGPRTNNGDAGLTHVRGPDGATFTYSDCSLSFNGTNHTRGQIPQILYYSAPQSSPNSDNERLPINDEIPRKNAIAISESVIELAIDLLQQAQECSSHDIIWELSSSHLIRKLLPIILAYLSPMATSDSKSAIQILTMIRHLLPLVVSLNKSRDYSGAGRSPSPLLTSSSIITTSKHYTIVESDHPYKPANVSNYKVCFPPTVKWMSVEFDNRCGTAQPEDVLQIYIPSLEQNGHSYDSNKNAKNNVDVNCYWPVLRKFQGRSKRWPNKSLIIPGSEMIFSLETASDYVKDDKASYYGFRCQVIGYENPSTGSMAFGLQYLEQELVYLSGICVGALLKKQIQLPQIPGDNEVDPRLALRTFESHSTLLSKGLSLSHPLVAYDALDGIVPLANEHPFLKDFCQLTPGTSGARLAKWFQCESFVDPNQCEVHCSCGIDSELQCGWPTVITVITRDQYGIVVNVPNLKVEVSAQPFHANTQVQTNQSKTELSFGGMPVPPPAQNVQYSITAKDKMFYHAITMMKQYEDYSFEELRYMSPIKRRTTETMLVRPNNDGTYTANWTPGSKGWYQLTITIDGIAVNSTQSVQVGEPPKGIALPQLQPSSVTLNKTLPCRTRKFIGRNSMGLRIRSLPSLQSEQIGIIEVNCVITIIEEVQNDDGVWVRLSPESVNKYCNTSASQPNIEAWCLQYNQHLGHTLLIPIGEPKPIIQNCASTVSEAKFDGTNASIYSNRKKKIKQKEKNKLLLIPGYFHVVKCGVSGHNIRSRPHLRASPIGMIVLGNVVGVVEQLTNCDGTWVKLDENSMKRYCFNVDGEAWSLSKTINDTIYLQHEAEVMHVTDEEEDDGKLFFSPRGKIRSGVPRVLPVTPFGALNEEKSPPSVACSSLASFANEKSVSSNKDVMSLTSISQSVASESEVESIPNDNFMIGQIPTSPSVAANTYAECERTEIDSSDYATSGTNSISSVTTTGSRVAALQKKFLNESEGNNPSVNVVKSGSPAREPPPELQGISVKELVKAIGRDRSPTPPSTPPSKRAQHSRSSSPNVGTARLLSESATMPIPVKPVVRKTSVPNENTKTESIQIEESSLMRSFTQKGTQTSPSEETVAIVPQLLQCDSAKTSRSPNASPKQTRNAKEHRNSRPNRSKREKPHSPVLSQNQLNGSTQKGSNVPIKEAMSNSVAECVRAVFAAFIWHEGILHDAIAVASYLKFNPEVTKDSVKTMSQESHENVKLRNPKRAETKGGLTKEQKAKFRHSVEVSQLSAMQNECYINANIESNKITETELTDCVTEPIESVTQQYEEPDDENLMVPETLVNLLKLWEIVAKSSISTIAQPPPSVATPANVTPPSTPVQMFNRIQNNPRVIQTNNDDAYIAKLRIKAARHASNNVGGGPIPRGYAMVMNRYLMNPNMGNFFGEAAVANGGGFFEMREAAHSSLCELCGNSYPYPVTHHMRRSHPGCGEHAGGKGYNSSGSFCGGWAGHCGDGGFGSSNWYLICDKCREKYLNQKKHNNRHGNSPPKSKGHAPSVADLKPLQLNSNPKVNLPSPLTPVEVHQLMKDNAMFLLRMSPANETGASHTFANRMKHSQEFPSQVSGFQCLESLGIHHSTYHQRLAEEHLTEDEIRAIQSERPSNNLNSDVQRDSFDNDSPKNNENTIDHHRGVKSSFHRSVSVGLNEVHRERANLTQLRKRATSNESSNALFLCHSSATLTNLVQACTAENHLSHQPSTSSQSERPQNIVIFPFDRPVMQFILQQHSLEGLLITMKNALRKSACRTFALQFLNWLLRNVSQSVALHDLMWCFVASLTNHVEYNDYPDDSIINGVNSNQIAANAANVVNTNIPDDPPRREETDPNNHNQIGMCQHPLSDLVIAGEAVRPLSQAFHTLLQTISDLMPMLPMGSPLQQIAVRCFCLQFDNADHSFLHQCHVFSNISKIFSRTEEENINEDSHQQRIVNHPVIKTFQDLTGQMEIKGSSRQAMIGSLFDNSTETFWESGDEDRNKTKIITVANNAGADILPKLVYIHIDNCRDLGSKVSQVIFKCGESGGVSDQQMVKLKVVDVENRFAGWTHCVLLQNDPPPKLIKLEFKGPDNTLRLRQIKILGYNARSMDVIKPVLNSHNIQQTNCEAETLRVFRLLTSQVFGKLISGEADAESGKSDAPLNEQQSLDNVQVDAGNDLREHMVGILFSRSGKLTHLQKQVCSHIVEAIRVEAMRLREEWETLLCSKSSSITISGEMPSDAYCFEMLSMVLALSGSTVGRQYLALQNDLLLDLFSLLHTGSARVQRQVTSLLRRVLPEIKPNVFALMFGISSLPPRDIITSNDTEDILDIHNVGIIDVFLSCIAKALTVQTKVKGAIGGSSSKSVTTVTLATAIHPRDHLGGRWWLRGCMSRKLAEYIISLLKDMTAGKLSDTWANVTKNAIAQNILNLTRLDDRYRTPTECIKTPTLWIALASLCVLEQEHAERLSSSHWVNAGDQANGNQPQQARPLCDNHDDGETHAIILCNSCGNLCAECDRYLHLHRKTRNHQRQVFKEEEEAIKVDLHEGCGRTKLFWVMALADSKTLKAMVEFRGENTRTKAVASVTGQSTLTNTTTGVCRFCGTSGNTGLLAIGNVCGEAECQEHAKNACTKTNSCGHLCGGVKNEEICLPCLHGCTGELKQDADDMCMICFIEALSCAPAIQLKCGHVFHLHCCKAVIIVRWPGPRITFAFSLCPICKCTIDHLSLEELLIPIKNLYEDVHRKALMRLEYEGLHRCEAITTPGARFFNDPAGYAMERYAYYVCCKCKKAYYGGEARCDAEAGIGDNYDPSELVCGGCSDVSRAQMCPKHGTDFLEYKCRYCCSVAVFFCFGTTHFCNACHDDFQKLTNLREFPKCPAGPRGKQLDGDECPLHVKHPPTGEEFALGCGVCRNAHTF